MKGEWKVLRNYVVGVGDIYSVGRILDTSKPLHSGNVEYLEGHFDSEEEAQSKANEQNLLKG